MELIQRLRGCRRWLQPVGFLNDTSWVGWESGLSCGLRKDMPVIVPDCVHGTTFGKRVLADIIKDLEQIVLDYPMTGIVMRDTRGNATQRKGGAMRPRGKRWESCRHVIKPEVPSATEAGEGKPPILPTGLRREHRAANILPLALRF